MSAQGIALGSNCLLPYLMSLYQDGPKNSPGVKFGPALGVTSFTWNYIGKTLEISLYLAIRPRLAKFSCSRI